MKAPPLYHLIAFIICSINAYAQIGPDGTGTINGYYIGPDSDLSGAPPEVLISGYYHNMVLTEEGECLAWGWGKYGQTIQATEGGRHRRDTKKLRGDLEQKRQKNWWKRY